MKWNEVEHLQLEISGNCNAACPQCPRHPTGSELLLPTLENNIKWSFSDMEKRLPITDLQNIKEFFLNGNFGDFVTHPQAIEIIEYLKSARLESSIKINTNGSARNIDWWKKLAKIPSLKINFAIDGLEDTHHLYRRNTNWKMILNNATNFIAAGGHAEWTMTLFEHNEHQEESCQELSKKLGFKTFFVRHSNRSEKAVFKNNQLIYEIRSSSKSPIKKFQTHNILTESRMQEYENKIKEGRYRLNQNMNEKKLHLDSINECESLKYKTLYIGSDWFVAPCCYIGSLSYQKLMNSTYADFIMKTAKSGIKVESLFATEINTVKNIVNRGFNWIYDKLLTENCLSTCYGSCAKNTSVIRIAADKNKIYDHRNTIN